VRAMEGNTADAAILFPAEYRGHRADLYVVDIHEESSMHAIRGFVLLAAFICATQAFGQGKAYVGNFKDDTVSVIDVRAGAVTKTVPVAAGPHGMAVSSDGATVYVTGDNSSSMSVVDTATDTVKATIDVGKSPHGLALTPDGRLLLVGVYGDDRVIMFDTATQRIVGDIAVGKPHTLAVRPDGQLAYVASQQPGKFGLVVLDLSKRTATSTIALDKPPRDLEFSADGKALYFTQAGRLSWLMTFHSALRRLWRSSAAVWSPALTALHSATLTPGTAAVSAAMAPCAPNANAGPARDPARSGAIL